jgi:hypothetical protein
MFAAAIAASAAAFADPINAISFEDNNYTLGKTFTNGDAEYNDAGDANSKYFCFTGGESNSSVVTNENPSTANGKRTATFAEATNTKFLALDTEGGTFWRSINAMIEAQVGEGDEATTTYSLGNPKAVAATGTYLDTLVQFTVTEDEAPTLGEGDKLAIWLQADEGTTNLMVKAAVVNDQGTPTETTFTINATVNPGEWYRLTVKALADITDNEGIPGFQIYLDGTLLASSTPTLTSEYLEILGPDDVDDSHYADLAAGKYFASLSSASTLQGVGFQGTGAVDEIVWTDDNPISAASTVALTLTWDANVTAVSYTIDGATTSVADLTSGTTSVDVAPGTVVTVAATPAAWYTVSGTGDVTVDAAMTQAITTALAATPADAGATGLPATITTAAAKTWADAKNLTPAQIAACSFAEKAYLLNTDLTVEPTFAITAIEEVTGGWKITVEAKSGSNTVNLEAINGTLKVKTGATLEALASATSTEIPAANLTFDADGKAEITITGTGKNFIKATVE